MTSIRCSDSVLRPPVLPGIEIISISAEPVSNFTIDLDIPVANHGYFNIQDETFCKVVVTYTHSGAESESGINVEVWLPWADGWNSRIMAVGGGGWSPGRDDAAYLHMGGAISLGYATFTTDAGIPDPWSPAYWALKSPGVTNYVNVENWGTKSLVDMAVVGKDIVEQFYEKPPAFSYFSGCSQGGRQGYELAQKYPEAFDGIAAAAPGLRLPELLVSLFWPQHLLNLKGEWPRGCELDSLDAIAVGLCDGKDGIVDGIISDPEACDPFDSFQYVGDVATLCIADGQSPLHISEIAAYIVNATWSGMRDESARSIFPGLHTGTDLSGIRTGGGVIQTACDKAGCNGIPIPLGTAWVQIFGMKDPDFDYKTITREQFYSALRNSSEEFAPFIGSVNPDLSQFRARGGKILTIHGLADQLVSTDLVREYYDEVKELDPQVKDFYRFFEVPGLTHCIGNGNPVTAFDALRAWVENGTAPAALPVTYTQRDGTTSDRIVCPYPQKVQYNAGCGDPADVACFYCKCQS